MLVYQSCLSIFKHHGLQAARLFCSLNTSGKNTEVGWHFLLQEIFPTQGSNWGLLHCRQILYHLNHQNTLCFIYYLFFLPHLQILMLQILFLTLTVYLLEIYLTILFFFQSLKLFKISKVILSATKRALACFNYLLNTALSPSSYYHLDF